MKEIIKAFDRQPVVNIEGRKYIVNKLIDHEPETQYELLEDVVEELSNAINFDEANKIVGEEDRGGYIAALMSYKLKKSLALVKWNPPGLRGALCIDFRNSYTHGKMYLHGVKKGDKVILVEDIIDTGGTLIAMINLLRNAGIRILNIVAVAEKIGYGGLERVEKETRLKAKCLILVDCKGKLSKVQN
jgi:adenine/guanine phosphoribosyltransferase-like PRPP-binding protein